MSKGFDCATPLTAYRALQFKEDGYDFVCRYLVPTGYKHLTLDEAEVIKSAGLNIVSVFETTASRALGGYSAGLQDGLTASQCADSVGQSEGSAIYFAVDFDATGEQMRTVIDYIRGANEATPNYSTGVYGSYAVCSAVIQAGVASRSWQTYAWSNRQKMNCQIYQYKNDILMNGTVIDLDESYGNEGWWGQEEEYTMSKEDADKIIGLLGKVWELIPDDTSKAEIHRLANELRKASNQSEEE